MILEKLQEALAAVDSQRKALDDVEAQLRSMIAKLSGGTVQPSVLVRTENFSRVKSSAPQPTERDKLDDIADILRQEGRPLHINVIAERLSDLYGRKVLRTQIEPGVNRHIQKVKQKRIDKFGPSTYGLPEWKDSQAA